VLDRGGAPLELRGRWQLRLGNDPAWSNIPLPARYGISPDILIEVPDPRVEGR
jgi:hypothetical protein